MLLGSSTTLPTGLRVRLRLPHGADRPGLRALHESAGIELDDMTLRRLLTLDPRSRCAVVATTWAGSGETIVGFAASDRGAPPDVVVAHPSLAPELPDVLLAALRERGARHVA